ncbi:MAG: hypothetical protein WBC77_04955 [Candidatus Zixiibacteriota bacterium]
MRYVRGSESPPDRGHFGPTVRAAIRDNIQREQKASGRQRNKEIACESERISLKERLTRTDPNLRITRGVPCRHRIARLDRLQEKRVESIPVESLTERLLKGIRDKLKQRES